MSIVSAGTTGVCTPACTSTTHGPGNTFIVASGAGCSTGIYEIISQSAGTVTFDRSTGAGTCVGVMGGSMLTIPPALNQAISGNQVWIQSGTYTATSQITSSQNVTTIGVTGYQTTHGDNGTCPTITTSTNSVNLIGISILSSWKFTNLCVSSTAGTPGQGFSGSGNMMWLDHVTVTGFSTCVNAGTNIQVVKITGNSSLANCPSGGLTFGVAPGEADIEDSTISNSSPGISATANIILHVRGMTLKNMATCITASTAFDIEGNTFYGCSTAALVLASSTRHARIFSNVFYNNTCGISVAVIPIGGISNATAAGLNAFGNNTNNGCGTIGYTLQTSDKTLSVDPFVNAAGGNFTPNSTVGGGATLKGAGFPTNLDIGAVQSASSTIGTGSYAN